MLTKDYKIEIHPRAESSNF